MRKKMLSLLVIAALPALTYATDIRVKNNTLSYGTGHFNSFFKICSSTLGDKGIMKPKQQDFIISGSSVKTACGSKDCEAFLYATANCSGDKIATVVINAETGIVKLENHATERFVITYTANSATLDNPARKGFMNWFKSLF